MPAPSKFTVAVKSRILEVLRVGASRQTAAALAGIDVRSLSRWLEKGRSAAEGSAYRQFWLDVKEAEAQPRFQALGIVQAAWIDKPELAWKYVQRREPGFEPPMPNMVQPAGPVVINLALADGKAISALPSTVIEVGDEQDGDTGAPSTSTA